MKTEVRHFGIALRRLFKRLLGIREGTDIEATVEGIQRDIIFRGHTAWILMFSIFIASIGLNVNSTAVIIGAMLISPLMGPILGIGLSVGTNDFDTLVRALKNLAIAVTISLLTSTLYFLLTPLDIEQTELLSRTKPTFLDVLVALFGGFAGIVAGSRREKSNVVPGVAIATALMPPLCTAGYGLATLKLKYFLGAFYLFFINSVFISLSTYLVVKYLKFPLVTYIDKVKLRKYRLILIVFLVLTIIPSTIIFYNVIQEARFKLAAENFINEKCDFEGSELINHRLLFNDSLSVIDLYYIGKPIDEEKHVYLKEMLSTYGLLGGDQLSSVTKKTIVNIHQATNENIDLEKKFTEYSNDMRLKILEDIYTKNEEVIKNKDLKIDILENEILNLEDKILKLSVKDTIEYGQICKELNFHFKYVNKFSYGKSVEYAKENESFSIDTIPVYLINFKKGLSYRYRRKMKQKIEKWLRVRMNDSLIKTVEY